MERTELITHLEHLAEYVKYSEDAPALREAISLLKTHDKRTETHVCDLIQPDHNAEVSKKVGDDLIRRHGVSAWLYNLGYPKLADIVMNEQRFRSAQPEQRWISCSERLPENKSYVLTTIYVPGRQPHARSGWFEDGLFMNDNGDTWKSTDREVCAWMPLPAPYHEESKSDE